MWLQLQMLSPSRNFELFNFTGQQDSQLSLDHVQVESISEETSAYSIQTRLTTAVKHMIVHFTSFIVLIKPCLLSS